MKRLLSVAIIASIFSSGRANALDVEELSYRKTNVDLTWNGIFSMTELHKYSLELNGFKYKNMYDLGSLQAGYELGLDAAPYIGIAQAGLATSMGVTYSREMDVRLNFSLGLEYVSISTIIPSGSGVNVYSNIGPSISVPVDIGRVGLSIETHFSHSDGGRTFSGAAGTLFISNEF